MNTQRQKQELGRLIQLHAKMTEQAVNALEARHGSIAEGVLPGMETTLNQIEKSVTADQGLADSVFYASKKLIGDIREKHQSFSQAITGGLVTEARVVGRWLRDSGRDLAGLLRLDD